MEDSKNGKPQTVIHNQKKGSEEALRSVEATAAEKTVGMFSEAEKKMMSLGKRNIYVCDKCFGHVVSVDIDEGVTPMFVECIATANCDGTMRSCMYRVWDQRMKPDVEWYRPTPEEIARLAPGPRAHVDNGGLMIRPHPKNPGQPQG